MAGHYWPGRGRRVGDWSRGMVAMQPRSTIAMEREGRVTQGDMDVLEANTAHTRLEAADAERQERRHMERVIETAKAVVASSDKRYKPHGVSKGEFKAVRGKMRLTRTKPRRKKRHKV